MGRKRTDNNSLILWPSGGIRGKMGSGKTPFFFLFLSTPPVLGVFSVQYVCVLDMLEYSQSPHGFAGLHPKSVCVSIYACYVLLGMYVLPCKPCVCVHIPVYTGLCVETYLFALCNQVRRPPRALFVSCYMDPIRIRLTRFSSISNFNIRVRYQCLGSGIGVCVCMRVTD